MAAKKLKKYGKANGYVNNFETPQRPTEKKHNQKLILEPFRVTEIYWRFKDNMRTLKR